MTTMNNEDPADPSVHEPRVTDAPDELWLIYGELDHDGTHANLRRAGDVEWSPNSVHAKTSFRNIFSRILALTAIPDGQSDAGCWVWNGRVDRRGYPRMNVRIDGKHTTLRVHRAVLVALECGAEPEFFADLYAAYSAAQFEADHLCYEPRCCNPDHLEWTESEENMRRALLMRAARRSAQ